MKYLKLYCPECGKEMDETEFMELEGICEVCYKNKHATIRGRKVGAEEDI